MARSTTTRNSWLLEGVVIVLTGAIVWGAYQLGRVYAQLDEMKIEFKCECDVVHSNPAIQPAIKSKKTSKKICKKKASRKYKRTKRQKHIKTQKRLNIFGPNS